MNLKPLWGIIKPASLTTKLAVGVVLALAGYIMALKIQNAHLTSQFVIETMRANNELAAGDSTRRVVLAKNDTLHAWEKLVVQEKQHSDDLDKQLKRETRLKAGLQLRVDSLVAVIEGEPTTDDSADVRHGVFPTFYHMPYTVQSTVDLPKPPSVGTMHLKVQLDPVRLTLRAQCGKPNAVGVRQAAVLVMGPAWADLQLDGLTQSPEVCMPQVAAGSAKRHFKLGAAVGAGLVILSHIFLKVP